MSPPATADDAQSLHPRATRELFGHAEAEAAVLAAYQSGRLPHAVLLVGPRGIGKATLAYRLARFVLARPDPAAAEVRAAVSLALAAEHPVARRVAARAQGDLLVLERTVNDKGVLRQQIAVDDVRRTVSFFGSTAGEGGWRVAIVDAVDELNRSSANALLKILEEPPPHALLLLVSHAAGRVSATIRSRCRIVALRPLAEADVAQALAAATAAAATDPQIAAAAAAADGSVARALALLDRDTLGLRERAIDLLDRLPSLDLMALHALGDALAGSDPQPLAAFLDSVSAWLTRRIERGGDLGRLARLAEAWDSVHQAVRDAETYNLERKPLVFGVFSLLAAATRG